ncbi:hypothetical protein ACQKMD_09870 [Viridibacillus sp. NPDC096237]|uniref:hypothetical protein n=1 Tax=Viridibacillus sp. NPDC096237 TaxID=3390721 RepID=UPI003D093CCB
MSPIYFPPSFCGDKAKLQLKKDLELINPDQYIPKGEQCRVNEIKGYAYFLKFQNLEEPIRLKESILEAHFDILDEGIKDWQIENCELLIKAKSQKVKLAKDLIIKDVVIIYAGKEFFLIGYIGYKGYKYWDLYDGETHEKLLNLRDDEYVSYFSDNEI